MYNLPFTGNLVTDLKLITETKSGTPRLNFKVAINENPGGDRDKEVTHFIPFTAFGSTAENMAASLKKGQRVTVIARLKTYDKEVQIDGEDKSITMIGFTAQEVGPALRWQTAEVSKAGGGARKTVDSFADEEESETPAAKPAAKKAPAKPKAKPVAEDNDDDDDDF
ncbi:single-stranded DNA-binding protein [Arthrobacter sp. zg-Y1110]|uniref:single-stranded DNA-binding protein n=1 Tax=Arthrobacter sp. zg-Y1110 TaxID=2886932 RepID=UPI001D1483FA|nr:single-stranded DNA-binding protein [Arthrobacter sp. zg-Y1110]MCC3292820.1 single-stranded DNA-binding protein [Arthrobacter sp. zg-Y1110]UWX86759.1 single-stranded DNA-binding protein [Arthrobacter sp. zg-Y1110]